MTTGGEPVQNLLHVTAPTWCTFCGLIFSVTVIYMVPTPGEPQRTHGERSFSPALHTDLPETWNPFRAFQIKFKFEPRHRFVEVTSAKYSVCVKTLRHIWWGPGGLSMEGGLCDLGLGSWTSCAVIAFRGLLGQGGVWPSPPEAPHEINSRKEEENKGRRKHNPLSSPKLHCLTAGGISCHSKDCAPGQRQRDVLPRKANPGEFTLSWCRENIYYVRFTCVGLVAACLLRSFSVFVQSLQFRWHKSHDLVGLTDAAADALNGNGVLEVVKTKTAW